MIETLEDKNKWIDFLHTLSKDELIEFIMNVSFDEIRTAELLQLRFAANAKGSDVDQLLTDYQSYVEACAYGKTPDANHIVRMTRILINLADHEYADYQVKILTEVRNTMKLLFENGVGIEKDDDFIFTMIGEQVKEMLENITSK